MVYQLNIPKYILNNWWGLSALRRKCFKHVNHILFDSINKNLSNAYSKYKNCSTNYGDYFAMVNATMKELYPKISINQSDFNQIIKIFEVSTQTCAFFQ